MPTLLLVDGSSYLYRAFHALPDLRNRAGEPTGAIYGVINMLRRLSETHKASHAACIFDAKGKTFRDDWYPQYKVNRPPMPEDLVRQIEPIHACVKALGWPLMMVDGVEADDVIGTLARQAAEAGHEVIISTGDKDMAQLVRPGVRLVNTMTNETLDDDGVLAKFGVPPSRIVDYLTLTGDTVDNVPGVSKCGPKTAVKWLGEYGDLDTLMARAGEVKGVVGENLRTALDFLPLGRRLVTIATDLSLPESFDTLHWREQDKSILAENYAKWEFKTWLRELNGEASSPSSSSNASVRKDTKPVFATEALQKIEGTAHRDRYECILTYDALDRWIARINAAPLTAFDTETDSLDPLLARLVGMSFCVAEGEAAYLPLTHRYPGAPVQLPLDNVLAKLKPWLESSDKPKLGQNLKYDMHILANHGIRLAGIVNDTLLESAAWESDKNHDLDSLAARHTGLQTLSYTDVCGKGVNQIGFYEVDLAVATSYGAEDADVTLRVHNLLAPKIDAEETLRRVYRDIEMPVQEVLWAMERQGVLIDTFLLAQQSDGTWPSHDGNRAGRSQDCRSAIQSE